MGKDNKPTQDNPYTTLQIIGWSLSILSFGMAIAFGGYSWYKVREAKRKEVCQQQAKIHMQEKNFFETCMLKK